MRKVKYREDTTVLLNGPLAKNGWFHLWINKVALIETEDGTLIEIPYTNFNFLTNPIFRENI